MSDHSEKSSPFITRRTFLTAVGCASIVALTSCTAGQFQVVHLNNAPRYENITSEEDIRTVPFAHLNAADLRGNSLNLFKTISREKAHYHAAWLADFFRREKIGILNLNELDYAGTTKTGGLDQPKIIAEHLGAPYNYVLFDQYLKSPSWITGNAVVSRFPMKAVHRHLYGDSDCNFFDSRIEHFFKDFVHVSVRVGKRELNVINTHLDDSEGEYEFRKKEEARELAAYIQAFSRQNPHSYIVVAGDFNVSHNSKIMNMLLKDGILHPPQENFGLKTHQNGNPTHDLDHILASSNIAIHNYRTFQFPWSDHLGLMCELEFLE